VELEVQVVLMEELTQVTSPVIPLTIITAAITVVMVVETMVAVIQAAVTLVVETAAAATKLLPKIVGDGNNITLLPSPTI
jgi:hypothetical protein